MVMMNLVNSDDNGESKGEAKKKKVEIDEENLKDVSMRKLVKMSHISFVLTYGCFRLRFWVVGEDPVCKRSHLT
ncbi:hypothetical protein YC2023_119620 [Brassica napus]